MSFTIGWSKGCLAFFVVAFLVTVGMAGKGQTNSGQFVGSAACEECHEEEYGKFKKYSKKAESGKSVEMMEGDLTEEELRECFACHVTGYGKPGGFVSFEKTPDMSDCGCEACHGAGYDHVESGGDPDLIKGDLELEDCTFCHNPERVEAFDFKPLMFGGAH